MLTHFKRNAKKSSDFYLEYEQSSEIPESCVIRGTSPCVANTDISQTLCLQFNRRAMKQKEAFEKLIICLIGNYFN